MRPRTELGPPMSLARMIALGAAFLFSSTPGFAAAQRKAFNVMEATVEDIHAAYKSKQLTSRQLVQLR